MVSRRNVQTKESPHGVRAQRFIGRMRILLPSAVRVQRRAGRGSVVLAPNGFETTERPLR